MDATNLQDEQYKQNKKEQSSSEPIKKKYNKKDLDALKARILADVEDFKSYKRTGCYYDPITTDIHERLKMDDRAYLMLKDQSDSGWSNTASTALFKNSRAIEGEYNDLITVVKIKADDSRDFNKDEIMQILIAKIWEDKKFKEVDSRTLSEMIRYGWAVKEIFWNRIVRPVKVPKKASQMSDDEKDLLLKDKIIPYEWKKKIDYNDVDIQNINPEDFFPERDAFRCYGRRKKMRKCAVIEQISYDEFLMETDANPTTIKKQQKKISRSTLTNNPNTDASGVDTKSANSNVVERIRYFNEINDEMVVLYNNEPVIVTTLPFHEIPFVDYHFINYKDKFFTPGLGSLLSVLMGDEEDLKNALKDELKIAINPPTYVDSIVFNEMLGIGDRLMPGEIIPITGLAANSNMIREMNVKSLRTNDVASVLNSVDSNQVEIAGINTRRFGSLQRSSNATEVATVDQASAKILRLMLSNLYTGDIYTAEKVYNWIESEYSKKVVLNEFGEQMKAPKTRKLILQGMEIIYPKTQEERLIKKRIEGASEFELKPEILKFKKKPQFYIDEESSAKLNRAANATRWQNILPQIAPFAGDPTYVQPGAPVPPWNINKLAEYYSKYNEIPTDALNVPIEDPVEDRAYAIQQNEDIFAGRIVPGEPGSSRYHLEAHAQAILSAELILEQKKREVQEEVNPMLQQAVAQLGIQLPTELPEERALRDIEYRIGVLRWHLEMDRLPRGGILPAPVQAPASVPGNIPQPQSGTPALPEDVTQSGAMPGLPPAGNQMLQ